jgi:hypothetical protein
MDIEHEAKPRESCVIREKSVVAGVTPPPTAPSNIDRSHAANIPRSLPDTFDEASAAGRRISDVRPLSVLADTDNVAEVVQDLQHVIKFINQSAASLSYTNLVFDKPRKGNFVSTVHPDAPNTGPCKLQAEAKENVSILRHERNMFQALIAVQPLDRPISLESTAAAVLQRAADELQRIDDIKAGEWERQRCSGVSVQPQDAARGSKVPVMINTGRPARCFFKCNFLMTNNRYILSSV